MDDWIYSEFVTKVRAGVHVVCIIDCCHSGTAMDLPFVCNPGDTEIRRDEGFKKIPASGVDLKPKKSSKAPAKKKAAAAKKPKKAEKAAEKKPKKKKKEEVSEEEEEEPEEEYDEEEPEPEPEPQEKKKKKGLKGLFGKKK